jgi:hypothetical protein
MDFYSPTRTLLSSAIGLAIAKAANAAKTGTKNFMVAGGEGMLWTKLRV